MPISVGRRRPLPGAHELRSTSRPVGLRARSRREHQRRRAVDDAARVAGGHRAVLAEGRAQLRERLERRVGLDVVVGVDDDVALLA
jgi:hypothetical protein